MQIANYKNYDCFPSIGINKTAYSGYSELSQIIIESNAKLVVMDCYPIVNVAEIIENVGSCFDNIFISDKVAFYGDELTNKMQKYLTDDRIFGLLTTDTLQDFFDSTKVLAMQKAVAGAKGRTLIIGVGAILIAKGDLNFHCSITRWESQLRFRKGEPNWNCDNYDMDNLTKFKRGYFVEWRIADKHKNDNHIDYNYYIDTNTPLNPKIITREDYDFALETAASRPFRVVPYFDPGVWGGQWMKEVCGLDNNSKNYAWCFDCVPEENSINYNFNGIIVDMPAIDLVFRQGVKLLGSRIQARFGNEFPIRFDFLDTMGGGNLSLQVHPTTKYAKENFHIPYTQDESYYVLDCEEENGGVYLGLRNNIDKTEFIESLQNAQKSGALDVEKYVNNLPARRHDHFLIPAGTVHCSGYNTMVLEISSTPYIFTFKLWDWGRIGLDGKPRAINIKHGSNVIDYSRQTDWVKQNLVNRVDVLSKCDNYTEEKTGLHELEFIETRRHWFEGEVYHTANGSVNVLNLVEGSEAEIISVNNTFEPFVVHYAETFIVPSNVGDYIIRPTAKSKGTKLATIKAYVRGEK